MKGIRSYLNFLERNKAYTAVNLLGFAIALMFVLVVGVYVYQELSLDHFHEDADRIVVQCTDSEEIDGNRVWMVGDALPVAYWLKDLVPDVEEVSPVVSMDPETRIKSGEKELRARLGFVESNFFTFFSFPLLSGSPEGVLQDEFSAVVSESFARRVFGHLDVAGQSLRISDSTQVTISGLMADMERTALPCFDVVLRVERATEFNPGVSRTSANVAGYAITCLKMRPGSDMNAWRETVLEFFKKNYWVYEDYCTDVKYLPLWDAYFQTESEDEGEGFRTGNRLFVDVLLSVVVLILAFAIFNYVNLGMAQTGFRAREVATRRLLGASRGAVIRRLAGEAVALTLIAYLLAVLLAFAVKTGAENLLQSPLDFFHLVFGSGHLSGACVGVGRGIAGGDSAGNPDFGLPSGGCGQGEFCPVCPATYRKGVHDFAVRGNDVPVVGGLGHVLSNPASAACPLGV